MATSGSVSYSPNRDALIKDSYTLLGEIDEDSTPDSSQINLASRFLNSMIKAWIAYGLHVWKIKYQDITLVASKATYTLGHSAADITMDRPISITDAVILSSGSSIPLISLSRDEYWTLPDLTQEGRPTQYYFDPQTTNSVIHFWPTPSADSATNDSVKIVTQLPMEDMNAAADDFDFPQEWIEPITYGLAVRLAPGIGLAVTERQLLERDAEKALNLVLDWDNEEGSIRFQAG